MVAEVGRMVETANVPTLRDPATKDEWCYLAGPIAIERMVDAGLIPDSMKEQPFHAVGEGALQQLQHRGLLTELMDSGDIVMLRMEKTDG